MSSRGWVRGHSPDAFFAARQPSLWSPALANGFVLPRLPKVKIISARRLVIVPGDQRYFALSQRFYSGNRSVLVSLQRSRL
jgi:hypothetical protein